MTSRDSRSSAASLSLGRRRSTRSVRSSRLSADRLIRFDPISRDFSRELRFRKKNTEETNEREKERERRVKRPIRFRSIWRIGGSSMFGASLRNCPRKRQLCDRGDTRSAYARDRAPPHRAAPRRLHSRASSVRDLVVSSLYLRFLIVPCRSGYDTGWIKLPAGVR